MKKRFEISALQGPIQGGGKQDKCSERQILGAAKLVDKENKINKGQQKN